MRLTFSGSGFRDEQPAWSPDGTKLAFITTRDSITVTWTETDDNGGIVTKSALQVNKEVYVMNADGSGQVRLTNTLENDDSPTWSSDGTKIAFRSDRERECCDPTNQVWVMNANGTNAVDLSNSGFGDYNPNWSNAMVAPPPPNGAQFISQSAPQTMIAGQTYAVSITMKNTGSDSWTTTSHYNLSSQNAQDNTTWGLGRVALPSAVASGSQVTFNFTVTAPATSGTYNFQWRMVQDGVEWFGDLTPNAAVPVNGQSGGNPNPNPEPDPGTPIADVRWIVADQLGTPRMIFDQSGSLAGASRHDYLPFGEELTGQIGGRTTQQGYTGDSTRQKFTQKERDIETGLDYFLARYYSSTQGRFTSVDLAGPDLANPQTLNMYEYSLNNPLRYTDPTGRYEEDVHRDLTTALAYAAGFSMSEATTIGNRDQRVDDDPVTNPEQYDINGPGYRARRDYHFTTEERRNELWNAFSIGGEAAAIDATDPAFWDPHGTHNYRAKAIDGLGVYMHPEQDSFAHAGYGPRLGHLLAGHAPDKTYNNVKKADAMALDSYNRLTQAGSILKTSSLPVAFNGYIAAQVHSFNGARNMSDKREYLRRIVWYVGLVRRRQEQPLTTQTQIVTTLK
jgi:RHS repeat-associated protein